MIVPEVKKILFVSDLSKSSRAAFYYAASLASLYGAQIDIFHAMEDIQDSVKSHVFTFLGEDMWKEYENKKESNARSALIAKKEDENTVQKAMEVLTDSCNQELQEGHSLVDQILIKHKEFSTSQEINKQCQNETYDLIVASYKCFTGLTSLREGSNIKKTIHSSNIPLLIIPTYEEEREQED